MKKIISFLLTCVALAGCATQPQQSPEQMSIEAVYSVDQKIIATSKTIAEVVAKAQSISLTGCPPEFIDGYRANVKAWVKFADVEKKMYTTNITKAQSDIEKFLSQYQTNATQATVDLIKEWPSMSAEINSSVSNIIKTFTEYTTIGAKYGAIYNRQKNFF